MPMDFSAYLLQVESDDEEDIVLGDNANGNLFVQYRFHCQTRIEELAPKGYQTVDCLANKPVDNSQFVKKTEMDANNNLRDGCWKGSDILYTPQKGTNITENSIHSEDYRPTKTVSDDFARLSFQSFPYYTSTSISRPLRLSHDDMVSSQKHHDQMTKLSKIIKNTREIPSCEHCHGKQAKTKSLPLFYPGKKYVQKRRVSFADDVGIPLTTIRVFQQGNRDADPKLIDIVSKCEDTENDIASDDPKILPSPPRELTTDFVQPVSHMQKFFEAIQRNKVCLENVKVNGCEFLGMVRVENIALEKHIFVRYTCDTWQSFNDVSTTYVPGEDVNIHDTFTFQISVDPSMTSFVEFAICYEVENKIFWDNNEDQNYSLYFK